ncbi:hypothetical protein F8388_022657 [Cannabis sativa]|uniref:Uncharacterized protein n=1 Tax=Cannabis sativa TaxID=3483 RepID=A0A7J6G1S4_CANSA|nr:hypothetical protein F8388_022657 [Cannabis sativa]
MVILSVMSILNCICRNCICSYVSIGAFELENSKTITSIGDLNNAPKETVMYSPTMKYNLFDKQAEAILNINLRRLTLLEMKKFINESESLKEQISKLEELL